MARRRKLTEKIETRLTPDWLARLTAVADHPRVDVPVAEVVRDCILDALPRFELALGIVEPGDNEVPTITPPAFGDAGWGPDTPRG